jgi:hypothetical protein
VIGQKPRRKLQYAASARWGLFGSHPHEVQRCGICGDRFELRIAKEAHLRDVHEAITRTIVGPTGVSLTEWFIW